MNGIWILLLLIITAALPVFIVFFLFKATKLPVTLPWFLLFLSTGIISIIVAVLAQKIIPLQGANGFLPVFFGIFIRIALVEEASRFVSIVPLLNMMKRRHTLDKSFYAALGLVSGLGFAMIESAIYGLRESDFGIIILRAITAAPLHGACGIRVCIALYFARKQPVIAFFLFISAVLIHGAYNLIILSPALPAWIAILIAITALLASIHHFTKASGRTDEETLSPPLT